MLWDSSQSGGTCVVCEVDWVGYLDEGASRGEECVSVDGGVCECGV